jgi:hypothetical protein
MSKLFVYVNGLRGPEPQIWDEPKTEGGKPILTLFRQELKKHEHWLGLEELAKRYPLPIIETKS